LLLSAYRLAKVSHNYHISSHCFVNIVETLGSLLKFKSIAAPTSTSGIECCRNLSCQHLSTLICQVRRREKDWSAWASWGHSHWGCCTFALVLLHMPLCNLVVLEFALPKEVFGFLDPLIVGIHRIVVVLYQSSSLLMLMKHASS